MSYSDLRHHEARFTGLPASGEDGWQIHRGKKAPVSDDTYIEVIVRTAQGYAISPRMLAFLHKQGWARPKKQDGAILRWRLADMSKPSAGAPITVIEPEENPARPERKRKKKVTA